MPKVIAKYPLRDLRKTHDLSQTQLAIICKTTPDRISTWENNKQTPRVILQARLARAFKMSLDELQDYCGWDKTPELMLRGNGGEA